MPHPNNNNKSKSKPKPKTQPKHNKQPKSKPQYSLTRMGENVGKYLGGTAGSMIGKIFGMGAYKVSRNVLYNQGTNSIGPPPVFHTETDGSVMMCAREYVCDVTSNTTFNNVVSTAVNPANPYLFPRLSQIAPNFEEYDFHGLIFEFNTTSGTAVGSTNTALGTVIMATQYDVANNSFTSKQQMESYMFSTSVVPCQSIIHPVECAPGRTVLKNLYVGTAAQYTSLDAPTIADQPQFAGNDPRLYDLGRFQLSTTGQQVSGVTLGELWVSYCIKLNIPRMNVEPAGVAHVLFSNANNGARINNALVSSTSDQSIVYTNLANTIFFPLPGTYFVWCGWYTAANNIASVPGVTSLGSNLTLVNLFNAYSGSIASNYTAANAYISFAIIVSGNTINSTSNAFQIGGLTGMTGATGDIIVTSVPAITGSYNTGF
jgi:hypothetical protein